MTGRRFDPERWQRVTQLFDHALELDAAGRRALLSRECGGDPELGAELERLLAFDAAPGQLDAPGAAQVRTGMAAALRAADRGEALLDTRIGPWRVLNLIGRGGMGYVFLAAREAGGFEQRVALKLLRAGELDDVSRRRFLEERRVLAKLAHPHIARLLDGGLGPDGEPWYAMEYVDGASLIEWCDARQLPVRARLSLFGKVCDAVDHAHRQLVIHRDIKPANILVDADGEPRLLDFGIAKLLTRHGAVAHSETRLMTPEYAAPEQLRNEPVGAATDVYALGAVLFELLTGQQPFPDPLAAREAPSALRVCAPSSPDVEACAAARGTTPQGLRRQLRGDLERILRAALDPEPARRYRSAAALAEDLGRHLRGHPISLRRERGYRFARFVARHRAAAALGTLAAVALIAALGAVLWQAREARFQAANATAVKDFMVDVFASADPEKHPGAVPDARELLDAGAQRLDEFRGEPRTAAALTRALAASYAGIGVWDRARSLAARALARVVAQQGARSAQALQVRIEYAEILQQGDAQQEARTQARQVLAQTRDAADAIGARAHLVLARVAAHLGDDARTHDEATRALAAARALGSAEYQARAHDLLAQAALGRGDMAAAVPALRSAVALYERSRGASAAQTLDERENLAFALLHSDGSDEALKQYAQLVADQQRMLGDDHPRTAATSCRFASLLWGAGRYREARERAAQAMQVQQAAASRMMVWQTSDCLMALVGVARARGDLAAARNLVARIEALPQPSGDETPRYLHAVHFIHAAIDAERGDGAAFERLRDLLARSPHLPPWNDRLDSPRALLALGRAQDALEAWRGLEATLTDPAQRRQRLAEVLLGQGVALVELGRHAEARDAFFAAQAAAGDDPSYGALLATLRLWRGWSQVRQGRAAAGLDDIEAALAWRRAQFGEDSYRTAEARLARAEAWAQSGRRAEAATEQARARETLVMLEPAHALRRRAALPLR